MVQSDRAAHASREPIRGCIVEADALALSGLRKVYQASVERLAAHGVKLDEGLFGRYLLGAHLEHGIRALLQGSGCMASAGEIGRGIQEAYLHALAEGSAASGTPLVKLVTTLAGRKVRVGLLTRLSEEAATKALAPLLGIEGVTLLCEPHGNVGGFGWDAWRRNARKLEMTDRLCVALVASGASAKPALAAGLAVVVAADPLAAHQDFSGTDYVAESLSDDVTKAVLQALRFTN